MTPLNHMNRITGSIRCPFPRSIRWRRAEQLLYFRSVDNWHRDPRFPGSTRGKVAGSGLLIVETVTQGFRVQPEEGFRTVNS